MSAVANLHLETPLRLKLRIYNNCLVARREALGLSQQALAKAARVGYNLYNALECLRESPLGADDDWLPSVRRLAVFHHCLPEDLFPAMVRAVQKNEVVRCLSPGEAERLLGQDSTVELLLPSPEETLLEEEECAALRESLGVLSARQRRVLALRFGLDGCKPHTLVQIGEKLGGICPERARQIELAGLRRLREHGRHVPALRGYQPPPLRYDPTAPAWLEAE